ncbi:hypothetical protein EC2785200_5019 [Escherichia coli 2785200]|nr:hypothetical protein EC2785200_5019 [Escherichia coli 2785200]
MFFIFFIKTKSLLFIFFIKTINKYFAFISNIKKITNLFLLFLFGYIY